MEQHNHQLSVRLKTIEGHIRGVERMTKANAYCIDIIKQVQAIQRALDKLNSLILADHLRSGVAAALRADQPSERERVVTELVQVFRSTSALEQAFPKRSSEEDRIAQRIAWLQQIEARVRNVQQSVLAGNNPIDIITQTKAIQRLLNTFNSRILEDHLNGCMTTAVRNEQPVERERMLSELLQVFDTSNTL